MSRRKPPKQKPFAEALDNIERLEHKVIARLVQPTFMPQEMLAAFYPSMVIEKLSAAFQFIRRADQTSYAHEQIRLPLADEHVLTEFTIRMDRTGMLVPEPGRWLDPHLLLTCPALMQSIQDCYTQHSRFEKLRHAVRWLNEFATAGAAKHYCPWVASLLPGDHPIQRLTGNNYQEPARGTAEIMPIMRECGEILATALLVGTSKDDDYTKMSLRVQFRGKRTSYEEGMLIGHDYISQYFHLI